MIPPLAQDSSQEGKRPGFPRRFPAAFKPRQVAAASFFCGLCVLLNGCGTTHYRRAADEDVYGIVAQVESQIFGHTNSFNIDTPYSSRNPKKIPLAELIDGRLQTNQRVLGIEESLDLAVNRSRRYQTAREKLYLKALDLTGQQYFFSPRFFASSAGTFYRTADGEKYIKVKSNIGFKTLLKTGGSLTFELANDLLHYYTGDPRHSVISTISVNLTQPLLRGFGRNNPDVEALTQAERDVVYAVRDYSFFQDQFALEVVNDYFDLLAEKQGIRDRYTNYLGRVQSTRRLEARANDRERLADVDQARQAELTAKNNYVNDLATYRNDLDQFKIKLGLPVGEKVTLEDQTLDELVQTGLVPAVLEADEAYKIATGKQLQILNAIDRFEDSRRKVGVAADLLKADVKFVGDASLKSTPPTDYARFDPKQAAADVSLEIDLPIDRLRERNVYRAALITFESGLRDLTLTLDTLKESILKGTRTLDQRRQNFEIQRNALQLANRRVASATMLLEAGRAEVRDLVEAQDAQISAQNAVTAALVDYQKSRLQLLLDIGALKTEDPKFWLKEGLQTFLPPGRMVRAPAPQGEQAVLPPEQYFDN